jgi:ketosteroid isomerase-like protein
MNPNEGVPSYEEVPMFRFLLPLALLLIQPVYASAQRASPAPSKAEAKAEAEVRETIRKYDEALRKADAAAVEKFWAEEYVFINPRGERLTRADRLANVRTGQTAFDSLGHVPQDEQIRVYGDIAVYTTLLSIRAQYGGQGQQGAFQGLVVWVRRDGRWQQIASQLTPVVAR